MVVAVHVHVAAVAMAAWAAAWRRCLPDVFSERETMIDETDRCERASEKGAGWFGAGRGARSLAPDTTAYVQYVCS